MNEKVFECFGLDYLNQREDLDRIKVKSIFSFLKCDLSIFNENEIIATLINNKSFSKEEVELIKFWAIILKSKKLFEMAEGSNLTDVKFDTKLKELSCSRLVIEQIPYIIWRYVDFKVNGVHIADIKGFYEEVAITMAKSKSLTVELIEKFDSMCVDWNYGNIFGKSVLMYLCKSKPSIDLLICLLDKEVDIDTINMDGETAFIELCRKSEVTLDMLKLFFDKGVGMDAKDETERTAFVYLCHNGSVTLDMIKLFFDEGVDISVKDDKERTAFMYLCSNWSVTLDMIKLFFDNKVDISIRDDMGYTSFMCLCKNRNVTLNMIKLFLEKGVDLNIRGEYDLNCLDLYIKYGGQNDEILKLLGQN